MTRREPLYCIFAVTSSLLINEIMLSAIFNVLIGAFNTMLAIAVALVGLSAAGIVVYLSPRFRPEAISPEQIYGAMAGFVTATVLATVLLMSLPVSHADLSYAPSRTTALLRLAAYLTAMVPFFMGGICVNLLLVTQARRVGQIYAFDLAGAATGCLVAVAVLGPLRAPEATVASTLPAALLIVRSAWREPRARVLLVAPALLLVCGLLVAARQPLLDVKRLNTLGRVDDVRFEGFKASARDLDYERWALDAWTIIRGEDIPQQWEEFRGWGLSERFNGFVPGIKLVNFNQRFSTYVTEFDGGFEEIGPWLDADLISLHHLLGRRYEKVLNIGAGGGREVLNALYHGSTQVTAVDLSEVTIERIVKGVLADFSGRLYFDPRVHAVADEGRSFVLRSDEKYDLIDFTIVGGTNLEKLDVMRIDDLFTREALATYLERLREDGVLSYVMYNTRSEILEELRRSPDPVMPYIPAVKTLVGLRETFESRVPDGRFGEHVLIAALPGVIDDDYDLVHITMSMSPFSAAERERFAEACRELAFHCLHPADARGSSLYSDVATAAELVTLERPLPFSISPTTDDRPFHYSFKAERLRTPGQWLAVLGANPLVSSGAVFSGIAVAFLFGPLLLSRRRAGNEVPAAGLTPMLLYFALIGCAYMLVEVSLILKLGLYLGRPVYALSIALFSFLLASGLGSALSVRLDLRHRIHPFVLAGGVACYGLFVLAAWPAVQGRTMALASDARAAVAVALIVPLALGMGMFFPLGVRLAYGRHARVVPWFWAVNGCSSIVGIFGCRILALFFGFGASLGLGLVFYLLTAFLVVLYRRHGLAPSTGGRRA